MARNPRTGPCTDRGRIWSAHSRIASSRGTYPAAARSASPAGSSPAASRPSRSPARSCTPSRSAAPGPAARPPSPCRSGRGAPFVTTCSAPARKRPRVHSAAPGGRRASRRAPGWPLGSASPSARTPDASGCRLPRGAVRSPAGPGHTLRSPRPSASTGRAPLRLSKSSSSRPRPPRSGPRLHRRGVRRRAHIPASGRAAPAAASSAPRRPSAAASSTP